MVKILAVATLGSGLGIGIFGLAWVVFSTRASNENDPLRRDVRHGGHWRGIHGAARERMRRLPVSIAVGLVCLVVTRWPVAGVLGTAAAATLPGRLRKVVPGEASKRADAVAGWTELLRDSMAASAGLAQAIVVTASSAPLAIRPQVGALATRLANGISLESALRSFALEVDEPAAEFLVCALLLAATSRAQKLVEVLSALVDSIREDVSMHLRVDASRAAARSSVRTVVIFSVAFALALTVVAHSYLSPFGTPPGQVVLAVVGAFYALGLMLMVQLVRPAAEMRLLDGERLE
jgi:Flp pilus assembly protein TadB